MAKVLGFPSVAFVKAWGKTNGRIFHPSLGLTAGSEEVKVKAEAKPGESRLYLNGRVVRTRLFQILEKEFPEFQGGRVFVESQIPSWLPSSSAIYSAAATALGALNGIEKDRLIPAVMETSAPGARAMVGPWAALTPSGVETVSDWEIWVVASPLGGSPPKMKIAERTSPFFWPRVERISFKFPSLQRLLEKRDFGRFSEWVMREALSFLAVLLSSWPPFFPKGNWREGVERVFALRESGRKIGFTIDPTAFYMFFPPEEVDSATEAAEEIFGEGLVLKPRRGPALLE